MIKFPFKNIRKIGQVCVLGLVVSACGKNGGPGFSNPFQRGENEDSELETLEFSENGKLKVSVTPLSEPTKYKTQIDWSLEENVDTAQLRVERWEGEKLLVKDISGVISGSFEDESVEGGTTYIYRLVQTVDSRNLEFAHYEIKIPHDWVVDGFVTLSPENIPPEGFGRVFFKKDSLLRTGTRDFKLIADEFWVHDFAEISNFSLNESASVGANGRNGGDISISVNRIQAWHGTVPPRLRIVARGLKGGNGFVGARGAKGARGAGGRDSEIIDTRNAARCSGGSAGEQGGRGGDGGKGGKGMRGGDAGLLTVNFVEAKSANLEISSLGGEGGDGGLGGDGGEGGDGGSGGHGCGNRKHPDGGRGETGNRGPQGDKGASGENQVIILNGQNFK